MRMGAPIGSCHQAEDFTTYTRAESNSDVWTQPGPVGGGGGLDKGDTFFIRPHRRARVDAHGEASPL